MSSPVIIVDSLSKRYILGQQVTKNDGFRHAVEDAVRAPLRWLRSRREQKRRAIEEFWALKDVSFEVKQGDVVGIIGRNGAGKSTLLKILSRITEPTKGRIEVDGRVASLLEVGTGFHQELTGRENIFLNGAILGMSRNEIKRKFDEIVAFAEVDKFLDTPVKRYSSGMYVRLAFAVAAYLEPEILVVDEVLAVGDAQFQKKCLGKMREVSKEQGRTVLFVSHNMGAVLQLTKQGIVLSRGRVVFAGPTREAVDVYSNDLSARATLLFEVENLRRQYVGTGAARFVSLRFDRPSPIFGFGESLTFVARIRSIEQVTRFRIGMTLFSADGNAIGNSFGQELNWPADCSLLDVGLSLPGLRLAPGYYYCGLSVGYGDHRSSRVEFDVVLDTLQFEVAPEEGEDGTVSSWDSSWGAAVFDPLQMSIPVPVSRNS